MNAMLSSTLFEASFSDIGDNAVPVTKAFAEKLFSFFKLHPLFKWNQNHNGCEARADAVCVLLEQWHIPHAKGWVFSGAYLKKHIGGLTQNWNYHVAPVLPVMENGCIQWYVIDPSTSDVLQCINNWAAGITDYPHSYHFVRMPHWYIFHHKKITATNWHSRNRQNRKWMIQGLAGINSLSSAGKAKLCFNKSRLKNTGSAFDRLKKKPPLY